MPRGVSAAFLAVVFGATALAGTLAGGNGAPGSENVVLRGVGASRAASPANRSSVSWCGATPSATDRQPDSQLSSPDQIHVVYAVPADGTDRFSTYASAIASDAAAIDGWWQAQDPTRTPRFDLYPFPGCTTTYGDLDISSVRLPRTGAAYGGPDGGPDMIADMPDFAALPSKKLLVYYDGPSADDASRICGTAYVTSQSPTSGGENGFVFLWLQSICPNDVGAGAFSAAVAAHETLHTLGAVPAAAPHVCPTSPGHVCDSTTDVLYPFATPTTSLATVTLDVGRDDYYGHSGSWLDVQDSPWLVHLPQVPLAITFAGRGSGTVAVVAAGSASCTRTCSFTLDSGTRVTLHATPGAGSRLLGWSGACSGTGDCTVTVEAATSVTATFAAATVKHRLTASVRGGGKVTSAPAGITCPGRCSAEFATAAVRLTERPTAGYRFAGWVGSCHGRARTCLVSLDRDKAARATFRRA